MDIVEEIRAQVNEKAGQSNFEVLEEAQRRLASTRFKRLRQWKTNPQTLEEVSYVYHLREYISAKLQIRRIQKSEFYNVIKCYYGDSVDRKRRMAIVHRQKMQEIEDRNGVDIAFVTLPYSL